MVEHSENGSNQLEMSEPPDIRFKNNGLDAIEVQDNGDGIPQESYGSIALKHHTSKLSKYSDLNSLSTFGFRGEALSSLCAVSELHVVTALAADAPKGARIAFEPSGRLKSIQVAPSQKGTTVIVEGLFENLPVRRRQLEKNIKREYAKVLGVLQAYACASLGVKLSVSNVVTKGKKVVVFATKSNQTTRENIANIFGAKTLTALVALNLELKIEPTSGPIPNNSTEDDECSNDIFVSGHVSKPIFGEGRQTPDRQMFFVNTRPCGLPQVSKVFNEVYKSFNVLQSPFIFADFKMDTKLYDVNVSPDKRTIFLHNQNGMLEKLRVALAELFESQDQTMPQSQLFTPKLTNFKQLTINRQAQDPDDLLEHRSGTETPVMVGPMPKTPNRRISLSPTDSSSEQDYDYSRLIRDFAGRNTGPRKISKKADPIDPKISKGKQNMILSLEKSPITIPDDEIQDHGESYEDGQEAQEGLRGTSPHALESTSSLPKFPGFSRPAIPSSIQNQILTISPKRPSLNSLSSESVRVSQNTNQSVPKPAYVKIGSKTTSSPIFGNVGKKDRRHTSGDSDDRITDNERRESFKRLKFSKSLHSFAAPGTQSQDSPNYNTNNYEEDECGSPSEAESDTADISPTLHASMEEPNGLDENSSNINLDFDATSIEARTKGPVATVQSFDEHFDKEKTRKRIYVADKDLIQLANNGDKPERESSMAVLSMGAKKGKYELHYLKRVIKVSLSSISHKQEALAQTLKRHKAIEIVQEETPHEIEESGAAEEKLSLTVSKQDFSKMRIVGQFNLGFILASRQGRQISSSATASNLACNTLEDELFIIDQHASDEKYNFERLQAETVVQNQRLVIPRALDLTAIEEELVIEHQQTLQKNGFIISIDDSGNEPVGQRCKLLSLPMSREVTFDTRDLEELLSLLAMSPSASSIQRPSKVRRMFAMRACRSSIMVGRTLTLKQMIDVVRHMGEMDKPWNCPHGRPTMRHLMNLAAWQTWNEGDGVVGLSSLNGATKDKDVTAYPRWAKYIANNRVAASN
ncbi:MAG: hypothetical protein M1829_002151 [Trizodia sp. TS-e1964]|nr:MAG: hypothetical protein M1829_002151 [Trizodia sp. TS-e1964]